MMSMEGGSRRRICDGDGDGDSQGRDVVIVVVVRNPLYMTARKGKKGRSCSSFRIGILKGRKES